MTGVRSKSSSRASAAFPVCLLVLTLVLAGSAVLDSLANTQQGTGGLEVLHVRGPIYMIAGAGGNITAQVGLDGVLLVDTGAEDLAGEVLATIENIQETLQTSGVFPLGFGSETKSELDALRATLAPPKPIRFILNTHVHRDHTGGNAIVAQAGKTITGGNVAGNISDAAEQALIYAHENVVARMSRARPEIPFEMWPTDTYFTDYYKLSYHINGEGVQLVHVPEAHTDGDSMVWFRGSDVISTGDLYAPTQFPVIDLERGGSIQGVLDGLNYILELAFPEFRTEGGTLIIPGHGRLSDSSDVGYYRDMVTIIRDRIQNMIERGMTLEEIQGARPTRDYDARYGATTGVWTTEMFVEAVYLSLSEG